MAEKSPFCLPDGLPAPKPQRDGMDTGFWEALRRHELVVQRCKQCGTFQHGPEWICHQCQGGELEWHKVAGRGRLYSWVRSWNPVHPALKEAGPYIIAVVELPDAGGVRMVGNLLGDPKQDAPFDAEVEAVFEDHPDATLVQWRLVNR